MHIVRKRRTLVATLAVLLLIGFGCSGGQSGREHGQDKDKNSGVVLDMGADMFDQPDLPTVDLGADGLFVDGEPSTILPVVEVDSNNFATSPVCATCHQSEPSSEAMHDADGNPMGFYDLWQGSMKANAARDPFFRAVVSAEKARHPKLAAAIDDKCLTCHAPMAAAVLHEQDQTISMQHIGQNTDLASLGNDGVSCTLCHAITPDNFGLESSFSGGFHLDRTRKLFGPFADPFARPMEMNSDFTPVTSAHIMDSGQCATCHTLFTHTVAPDNASLTDNAFPEQTPYLEWRNSVFSTEVAQPGPKAASCQDCHVPTSDDQGRNISTRLAHRPDGGDFPPLSPRTPVGRHLFVGGNTLVPQMFIAARDELFPLGSDSALEATIAAAKNQLNISATLDAQVTTGSTTEVLVTVQNAVGHKFPSGFPSRRLWLHVTAVDADQNVVFESGGYDATGQILNASGAPLERIGAFEPHRDLVDSGDQAIIYEAIMGDTEGRPTVGLLQAHRYLKDNRLLPEGWTANGPDAEVTAPAAVDDVNFIGGSDQVRFIISDPNVTEVQIELVYQTLGERWARELFRVSTPDVRRFERLLAQVDARPVRVAEVVWRRN